MTRLFLMPFSLLQALKNSMSKLCLASMISVSNFKEVRYMDNEQENKEKQGKMSKEPSHLCDGKTRQEKRGCMHVWQHQEDG